MLTERRRSLRRRYPAPACTEAVGGDHPTGQEGRLRHLQGPQYLWAFQHPAHGQGARHQGALKCVALSTLAKRNTMSLFLAYCEGDEPLLCVCGVSVEDTPGGSRERLARGTDCVCVREREMC